MSGEGIPEAALREVVAATRKREPTARIFAIQAGAYRGKPNLALDDGQQARVHWCESVLEFRQRLTETDSELVVLVTPHDERELGEDAIGSVARRRLERVGVWEPVKALFRATAITREVESKKWLAEALVARAPKQGYAPAPGGALTYSHALTQLSAAVVGTAEPTASGLIEAFEFAAESRLQGEERIARALGDFHAARLGPVAAALFSSAVAGHGGHAVALGLAAQVVFAGGEEGMSTEQREAAVRFERFTGGREVPVEAGSEWGVAAERLFEHAPEARQRTWVADAERLLSDLRVAAAVHLSDFLPAGLSERIDEAARKLHAWLKEGDAPAREAALQAVGAVSRHRLAIDATVHGLEMTARLIQFAHTPEPAPAGSLGEAAWQHLQEGGPLDWARQALDASMRVPAVRILSEELTASIDQRREARSLRFAKLLASATGADQDDGLRVVERVQAEVIEPLARAHPLLVIVLDGMSEAAFQALRPSICARGWEEVAGDGERRPPTLAVLPSLTKASRASLLCGKLASGPQGVESNGFAETLRGVGRAQLFHRAELRGEDQLREAIADEGTRVVGVVVNAIDDMLDKGDQIGGEWTLERIEPLGGLLDEAAESGRLVVLASDHGHVLERRSELRSHREGGSRWRPVGSGAVEEGEVEVRGRRVLEGGGELILAAVEGLRYRPKASGYHGGATPQEVVAPVAAFAPSGVEVDGLCEVVADLPSWWSLGELEPEATPAGAAASQRRDSQERLFAAEAERLPVAPEWIDRLLASPQYALQRERAHRPPADERVKTTLSELDRRSGVATVDALARALDIPTSRGRTILSSMQLLLNVDGYGILTLEASTNEVRLDRSLLHTQFEL